jgi:small subunit ribosomal protein S17e
LGKSRRVKTKRLADELLKTYPTKFTADFDENKNLLEEVVIISSKTLRNKLAGYLTSTRLRLEAEEASADVET